MKAPAEFDMEPVWKKDADGNEYHDQEATARNLERMRKLSRWAVGAYVAAFEGTKPK